MGLPSYYIIMLSFALELIGPLGQINFFNSIFFLGVITALSIATYGSMGELEFSSCLKTKGETTIYFISFLIP